MSHKYAMPKGYGFWQQYNEALLKRSFEVYVLMLDGWRESRGVTDEIRMAMDRRILISYKEMPDGKIS